ncbi:MAG: hypothetical protein J6C95_07430 [Muribaculaceae bacterium]|nr:hypothetical protein [Muribaculaceae bacterium]
MILSIFQTVEFYVVMVFIAAAVVGLAAMPSRRGEARQQLVAGELIYDAAPSVPGIVIIVNDDATFTIYRFGLENVAESGAFSLAVTFIGFDITIDERVVYGRQDGRMATAAQATIKGVAPERYHILYRSEATGRNAALSLNMRPGNRIDRELS